ncbi:hypothetical protein [Paenibacillus sp.]|jgi:hypothetical protein|uniref:hypothetical protein n=1 Tax=Paenibacillus sp. TaxID=58172 RepID=UPI00281864D3|nr:hypothetical protein [Paenibacillus sp.]MDR0270834.1 hypothetical protein [Paenibacillus sp.]
MKASKKLKSKFFGILSLVIFSMFTSVSLVSAGSGASASTSMYKTSGYLQGGVSVDAGYEFVPGPIRAYFELYKDGTFLGSKQGQYLSRSAVALVTDKAHSQSGLYTMTWSGRVGGYYSDRSDWSDAGQTSYY